MRCETGQFLVDGPVLAGRVGLGVTVCDNRAAGAGRRVLAEQVVVDDVDRGRRRRPAAERAMRHGVHALAECGCLLRISQVEGAQIEDSTGAQTLKCEDGNRRVGSQIPDQREDREGIVVGVGGAERARAVECKADGLGLTVGGRD